MGERIYTAAEALALLEGATGGTWSAGKALQQPIVRTSHNGYVICAVDNIGGTGAGDAIILAASKDLAASVAHHAARADKAEAALDRHGGKLDIPMHLRFAIAGAERAFRAGDFGALATVNEDIQPLVDAAVASIRQVMQASRAVLESWKVTEAQCDEGRWCRECREPRDAPHDDLCDLRDIAEREALAQLKAAMVPHD